jgi:hypothetical protein
VLHKVKKPLGGSRWKLWELTHVSRFLDYGNTYISNLKKDLTKGREGDRRRTRTKVLSFIWQDFKNGAYQKTQITNCK